MRVYGEIDARLRSSGKPVPTSDLLIACTGLDEVNLVACAIANRVGAARTFCFVSRDDFLGRDGSADSVRQHFGIERIIWPEAQLAEELTAIGKLAAARSNRAYIIPGDHDAAVGAHFVPALLEAVADLTGSQQARLTGAFLAGLHTFDIVYAWGVLHHTGAMWQALDRVAPLVRPDGRLFLAIYNDQGGASRRWRAVKRLYNKAPRPARPFILVPIFLYHEGREALGHLIHGRHPFRGWRDLSTQRGMHRWYDWLDWIGGYPFEVAKPEEIFGFYRARGFVLTGLVTQRGGPGCNEYVFLNGGRGRRGCP